MQLRDLARGRRRVRKADVWRAFQHAHPLEALAGDARTRLMNRLRKLAEAGAIELPSERGKAWDRSARPPIPEWVALSRPVVPAPSIDVSTIPWAPELAFVASSPGLRHLDEALAIHRFLASGGRSRPMVPMRERSVELFGDEKRLERLGRTPLFGEGRLTTDTLRCFPMAPPLVFELGPAGTQGRPCLVLENHHTWWSFCRWNERTADYSAVVYGAGGGFGRDAVSFLAERCADWGTTTAEYFGDVDREGLTIPWRAARKFSFGLDLHLVPATRWYRLLIDIAGNTDLPVGPTITLANDALAWLPASMGQEVWSWLSRGIRLPQELVGTERLLGEPSSRPDDDVPF